VSVFRAPREPKVVVLTRDQHSAYFWIDKYDGIDVPELAKKMNRPESVAYRIAEQLLAKKRAYVDPVDQLLYVSRAHYRAVLRSHQP
jgi:hypothetical protein